LHIGYGLQQYDAWNLKTKLMGTQTSTRRHFVKVCLGMATLAATQPARVAYSAPVRHYTRSLLIAEDDQPLTASSIQVDQAYVFHYPFVTTPCFLLNLGKSLSAGEVLQTASEQDYTWQGGVGPNRAIVAFSAICAHKLSYPTRTLSFLNYRPETVRFESGHNDIAEKSQIIYCCSERSAYDPARGAAVLGGPATQPLAAVELEYDSEADRFYAVGTRGGELYEPFFDKFGFRLALDHKLTDIRAPVSEQSIVYPHSTYSKRAVAC